MKLLDKIRNKVNLKQVFICIVLMVTIIMVSCEKKSKSDPVDLKTGDDVKTAHDHVNNASKKVGVAVEGLTSSTGGIKRNMVTIEGAYIGMPSNSVSVVKPAVDDTKMQVKAIEMQTDELKKVKTDLDGAHTSLAIAEGKVKQLEDQVRTAIGERDEAILEKEKAIAEKNDALQKQLRIVIIVSILAAGVGVALISSGTRAIGTTVLISAISSIVLCFVVGAAQSMLTKYMDYIAFGVVGLVSIAVGIIIWQLIVRQKAIKEVVQTTEAAKVQMLPEARLKLFGYQASPGDAFQIQSTSTEKMVNKIRKGMKDMWDHTIEDPNINKLDKVAEKKLQGK